MTDSDFMKIAIDISSKEEYPFGAIIVKDGKIVGRSDKKIQESGLRVYPHAEYRAIQNAIESGLGGVIMDGFTVDWKIAHFTQVVSLV